MDGERQCVTTPFEEQFTFLSTSEVAQLLRLPKKTVTQLAREGKIPGKKYGKHWRFLLSDILDDHRENAVAAGRKEAAESHGDKTEQYRRSMVRGLQVHGPEDEEEEEVQTYDWTQHVEGGSAEARA